MAKKMFAPMLTNIVAKFDDFKNLIGFDAVLGANAIIVQIDAPHIQEFTDKKGDTASFNSFSMRVINPLEDGTTETLFINSAEKDLDKMQAQYEALKLHLEKAPILVAGKPVRAKNRITKDRFEDGKLVIKTNYSFIGAKLTISDETLEAALPTDVF